MLHMHLPSPHNRPCKKERKFLRITRCVMTITHGTNVNLGWLNLRCQALAGSTISPSNNASLSGAIQPLHECRRTAPVPSSVLGKHDGCWLEETCPCRVIWSRQARRQGTEGNHLRLLWLCKRGPHVIPPWGGEASPEYRPWLDHCLKFCAAPNNARHTITVLHVHTAAVEDFALWTKRFDKEHEGRPSLGYLDAVS